MDLAFYSSKHPHTHLACRRGRGFFRVKGKVQLSQIGGAACIDYQPCHQPPPNNTQRNNSRAVIREAKRKAATLENFEEAMERTGGTAGGAQRKSKVPKNGEEGRSATKLHRLLEMFKVGAAFRLFRMLGRAASCCRGRRRSCFHRNWWRFFFVLLET